MPDDLMRELANIVGSFLPGPLAAIAAIFLVAFLLINFVAVYAGLCTYAERKVAGHIQARVGPYRVGPHGILQWLADAVKLILKEDIVPARADALLFKLAPYVVFAGSFACWVALPLAPGFSPASLDVGVLYVIALGSSVVLGVLMSGWSSGNKWALFGAMRSAAQIVSYEIPTGLTVVTILLLVGSMNMHDISARQATGGPYSAFWGGDTLFLGAGSWFAFRFPPFTLIAFLILYICALAETNRVPFDIPEAESELVAGYHTEYTGFRFSIFFLSEYANMFVTSAIVATLFLGGWLPPFPKLFDHQLLDAQELASHERELSLTRYRIEGYVEAKLLEARPARTFRLPLEGGVIPAADNAGALSITQGYEIVSPPGESKLTVNKGTMIPGIWLAAPARSKLILWLEGLFWFFAKCFVLVFFMMWLRWTIPRYRVDQLMEVCWKKLTPLAFANLFAVSIAQYFSVGGGPK